MKNLFLAFTIVLGLQISAVAQVTGTMQDDTLTNYIDINKKKQGKWVKYYDSGKIKYKGYFVNDQPTGTFMFYHTNGKIKSLMNYDDNGFATTEIYWKNGNDAAKGQYNDKKERIGKWEIFFEDGSLASIINYNDSGKAHGEVIMYYPGTTRKVLHCNYKEGKKHGYYEKFFQSGLKQEEGPYENNLKEGMWKHYSPEGIIEEQGMYKEGKREGDWIVFTEEKGLDTVNYKMGRPDNYDEVMEEWRQKEEWAKENQHLFKQPEDYLDNPFEFFKPSNIQYPTDNK
ncbi:MAG: hypothetical protein JXR36_04065 [Bacteroidales bacterium]|nr:hypothetical protein [Bacteroidales bacterium]